MPSNKNKKILIIDNNRTMLRIIRALLVQLGFNDIDETTDGNTALEKLQDKEYGLVIADWNIEHISGLELLKHIRAHEKLKSLPFILMTADSTTEQVLAARKAGVNHYIAKPFNAQTLKTKLTHIYGEQ